ncbi:hypothetical protein RF11_10392 [Thelohanellus kitauei]|uniref:Uncharacterized protein n=1 Tax=Thelohanellus kitauei TaxID=669202 RepID=A0A0C2N8M0_THEKT|nr:hypothetical protein RF11_10392 [Thelohanellus kitauei]
MRNLHHFEMQIIQTKGENHENFKGVFLFPPFAGLYAPTPKTRISRSQYNTSKFIELVVPDTRYILNQTDDVYDYHTTPTHNYNINRMALIRSSKNLRNNPKK